MSKFYRVFLFTALLSFKLIAMEDPGYKYFQTLENVYKETGEVAFTNGLASRELFFKLKEIVEKLDKFNQEDDLFIRYNQSLELFVGLDLPTLMSYLYGAEYFLLKQPYNELLTHYVCHSINLAIIKLKENQVQDLDWIKSLPKLSKDIEDSLKIFFKAKKIENNDNFSYFKIGSENIIKDSKNELIMVKSKKDTPHAILKKLPNAFVYTHNFKDDSPINNDDHFNEDYLIIKHFRANNNQILVARVNEFKFGVSIMKTIVFKKNEDNHWMKILNLKDFGDFDLDQIVHVSKDSNNILLLGKDKKYYFLNFESKIIQKLKGTHKSYTFVCFTQKYLLYYYGWMYGRKPIYVYSYGSKGVKLLKKRYVYTHNYLMIAGIIDLNDTFLIDLASGNFLRTTNKGEQLKRDHIDNLYQDSIYISEDGMFFGTNNEVFVSQFQDINENKGFFKNKKNKTFAQELYEYLKD